MAWYPYRLIVCTYVVDGLHQAMGVPSEGVTRQQSGRIVACVRNAIVRLEIDQQTVAIQLRLVILVIPHDHLVGTNGHHVSAACERGLVVTTWKVSATVPGKNVRKLHLCTIRNVLDGANVLRKVMARRGLQRPESRNLKPVTHDILIPSDPRQYFFDGLLGESSKLNADLVLVAAKGC